MGEDESPSKPGTIATQPTTAAPTIGQSRPTRAPASHQPPTDGRDHPLRPHPARPRRGPRTRDRHPGPPARRPARGLHRLPWRALAPPGPGSHPLRRDRLRGVEPRRPGPVHQAEERPPGGIPGRALQDLWGPPKSVGAQILRSIDGIRHKLAHQLGPKAQLAIEYLIYCPDYALKRLAAASPPASRPSCPRGHRSPAAQSSASRPSSARPSRC